jgi:hypothetical protein
MYRWILFLHILSAFIFMIAHGASANITFKLRQQTSREGIAALLDLSSAHIPPMYVALLTMLLTGIVLGFLGRWWRQGWIWASLGLLVAEFFAMWYMASVPLSQVRKAVGLPYFENMKPQPAVAPAPADEIAARVAALKPLPVAFVGFGGLGLIVWLMMFKPF